MSTSPLGEAASIISILASFIGNVSLVIQAMAEKHFATHDDEMISTSENHQSVTDWTPEGDK